MNNYLKIWFFVIALVILNAFSGCKSFKQTPVEKTKVEEIELSERDKLKSTVLLIDASKEKMLGNWLNASALYSEALVKNPENAAAAYELAKIYTRGDHFNEALKYAKKAINVDPENQHYLMLLADIYILKDQFDEAAKIHQKIADLYPEDLSLQLNLISTYIYMDEYDKVINIFDHIESITGFSDELSIEKIQLFIEMELYDEAIKEAKKLISYFPDQPLYVEFLAEIYNEIGEQEKAIELYRDIIENDPGNALARLHLAEHYRQKGKMDKSFEELKKAFKSPQLDKKSKGRIMYAFYSMSEDNPEYLEQAFAMMDILIEMYPEEAEMYAMYGDFLFREEEYEKAREKFVQSAKLDPDQYLVWEQILYISSQLEDYEFMIEYSEKALEYFFEQPILYYFNGIAHYHFENYEKASQAFEYGVELVVDNKLLKGQFYTLMGDSNYYLDNHQKSDRSYEKALEIDPENTIALNNYSYFLSLRNENLEYAIEMSEKANKLEKNNPSYLDTYGWIMYKMGKYEEAEKWIKKAMDNSGDDNAVILEHYGDVLYKLERKDEALKYWEKAGEKGNGSDYLDKKIKTGILHE